MNEGYSVFGRLLYSLEIVLLAFPDRPGPTVIKLDKARKSRRTLQNKVRIKVFPEQFNLFVNTFVIFKK